MVVFFQNFDAFADCIRFDKGAGAEDLDIYIGFDVFDFVEEQFITVGAVTGECFIAPEVLAIHFGGQ